MCVWSEALQQAGNGRDQEGKIGTVPAEAAGPPCRAHLREVLAWWAGHDKEEGGCRQVAHHLLQERGLQEQLVDVRAQGQVGRFAELFRAPPPELSYRGAERVVGLNEPALDEGPAGTNVPQEVIQAEASGAEAVEE